MKKRILSMLLAVLMVVSILPMAVFAENNYADTVVYGTIRTAEADNPVAEAIAIKDGKYIYVGDETGVAAYIKDGVTKIINYRGKGMVMPGATDGHSHYTMKFAMENMTGSIMFDINDDKAAVLQKLAEASLAAQNAGKQCLFGFGWNTLELIENPPTLAELDEATHGVSALIFDQGGHHAFCNSECLKRCGIIDGAGGVLIKKIAGGYLELDENDYPTGYANERVTGYLMRMGGIVYDEIFNDEIAKTAIEKTQELLLSTGYTMALDGWSNMLHPSKLYEAANNLDKQNKLNIIFPMTYEIEPWMTDTEIENEINNLASLNETYGTSHVLVQYLKLFMDGVVETKTGAMVNPYEDDHEYYKSFWDVDRLADITASSNANDLTVHVHAMGDAAVRDVTDAYIQGGDSTHRNAIVHLRNVCAEDYVLMAENNIACTAGFTWHAASVGQDDYLSMFLNDQYVSHAYPIKSFFDAGVKVSSHSDFPANIPCPQDPFGIMHVAVNGMVPDPEEGETPYDENELVTVEQAFQALTINGAWQLGLENERGSIKVGKWADFVYADQDVFTCEKTDIGKTKVVSTWFEGEKVYGIPHHTITNGAPESDSAKNHGYIAIDKTSASEDETVTVNVNPADGYQLKSLTVAPTGFVDLGIKDAEGKPLYWKETNLGANNAQDPGDYYMWGATALMYSAVDRSKTSDAFTFVTENPYGDNYKNTWDASLGFDFNNVPFADGVFKDNDGERNVFTKYTTIDKYAKSGTPDNITALQPEDDAATAKNANWHTPTYDELVALSNNCVLVWTSDYNSTGNAGYIVYKAKNDADKGKANMNGTWKMWDAANSKYIANTGSEPTGYSTSDIHIFLPAAGVGNHTKLEYINVAGCYCSSNLNTTSRNDYMGNVIFNKSGFNLTYNGFRNYGFSIRPVMNFSEITPAKQTDGTYQFTMPGYAVTVTAEFEEEATSGGGTETTGEWFGYCGENCQYESGSAIGVSDTTTSITWAIRIPAAALPKKDVLSMVSYFVCSNGTYKVRIYETEPGAKPNGDNPDYEQEVVLLATECWKDIVLTTPYQIDSTKDLWIAIENADCPFPATHSTEILSSTDCCMMWYGNAWYSINELGAFDLQPWMIRGYFGTVAPAHTHSFTYTANDNKITATCVDGCDKGYDTTPLTLTLTAPASLVYDGNAKAFTFANGEAAAWTGAGLELPTITYYQKYSGQGWYTQLNEVPVNAGGDYMAEIVVNNKAANVKFTIDKATPYIMTTPAPNDIEYGNKLSDSTLFSGYVQISTTDSSEVGGQFAWTNPDTVPGIDDSEITEYDVTFTPADTNNYNTVSCKVKIKVTHTHNPVLVNGQAATETASGCKDYYKCDCGALFEDENGTTPIENLENWKAQGGNIPKLNHNPTLSEGKTATFNEPGYKPYYLCNNCGKYYYSEDATGLIEIPDINAWKAEGGAGYIPKLEEEPTAATLDLQIGDKKYYGITGNQTIEVKSLDDIKHIKVLVQNGTDIEGMSDNWSMSTDYLDGEGRGVLEVQVFEEGDDYVIFNLVSHYADCPNANVKDFQVMMITAKLPAPDKFTVTFNMNGHGTEIAKQEIESGNKATKPADPTADGYTFDGWYADATFSVKFDFNSAVTKDTTVYAKWTKNSVTPTDPKSPQTGDTSNMTLWVMLVALSSMVLCACLVLGKKSVKF